MVQVKGGADILFNSPLETGLRTLFVLEAARPHKCDLQRLVSLDYLLVHSGDLAGPPSVHPSVPFRGSEWVLKRKLIKDGLDLMYSRELIGRYASEAGLSYYATDMTQAFLKLLTSPYARALRVRAAWLSDNFGAINDRDLQKTMTDNVGRWGAEFESISALQELEL